jgi:predicted DCC family thiol-disulfide oxidoreductase YuxK
VDGQTEIRIILFDGTCNLCNSVVRFVIPRDPSATFSFATLQSDIGQALLHKYDLDTQDIDSVVLSEGGKAYTKSSAVLRIARRLSSFWPIVYGFILIPRIVRDEVYDVIAKHRYRWFGQSEHCLVPTPTTLARFLSREEMEAYLRDH